MLPPASGFECRKGSDVSSNVKEYGVSEIAFALKRTVEDAFGLVRVRGEISGYKRAASGHAYLTLKDDKAVLDGVCWRGTASRLAFRPEDGLEVVCTGKLTTYPGRSRYQLVIEHMEPAGAGALMALLEERKRKLAAEGLFDAERKRPLPFLPEVIGIVTSPTGAVLRDMLHRLAERFPRRVILWPVAVQGEGAAEQIAAAITGFERVQPRPDLLIVARGGGSIEDLWSFNEEVVLRAAAASTIPLISAVGHETDTTLIDHVSDRRAPTPTAAAEMAVPVRAELLAELRSLGERQIHAMERHRRHLAQTLEARARGLPEPRMMLGLAAQRLDDLGERLRLRSPRHVVDERTERLQLRWNRLEELSRDRLHDADRRLGNVSPARLAELAERGIAIKSDGLASLGKLLASLGHQRVLERGYALVHDSATGKLLRSKSDAESPSVLEIEFHDGRLEVSPGRASRQRRKPTESAPQLPLL